MVLDLFKASKSDEISPRLNIGTSDFNWLKSECCRQYAATHCFFNAGMNSFDKVSLAICRLSFATSPSAEEWKIQQVRKTTFKANNTYDTNTRTLGFNRCG
jgi:hypothetical protein